jgi:hypothetical protein
MKYLRIILFLNFFLIGCGESPLLNHTEKEPISKIAKEPSSETPSISKNCDIKFEVAHFCASVVWTKAPMIGKPGNELKLEIFDNTNQKNVTTDFGLELKPFMPSMGHGVKQKPLVNLESQVGHYSVENIYFSMDGDWELWFLWTKGGALIDKAKIDLTL